MSDENNSHASASIEVRLSREMRLLDITMIGVGAMIGAGIFVLTGLRWTPEAWELFSSLIHLLRLAQPDAKLKTPPALFHARRRPGFPA